MSLSPIFKAVRRFFIERALKWEYRFLDLSNKSIKEAQQAQQWHIHRIVNLEAQLRDLS